MPKREHYFIKWQTKQLSTFRYTMYCHCHNNVGLHGGHKGMDMVRNNAQVGGGI